MAGVAKSQTQVQALQRALATAEEKAANYGCSWRSQCGGEGYKKKTAEFKALANGEEVAALDLELRKLFCHGSGGAVVIVCDPEVIPLSSNALCGWL